MGNVEAYNDEAATAATARMFTGLLADTHLSTPDEVSAVLASNAVAIGVECLVMYLVDYEQTYLVPVPGPQVGERSVLRIEGTLGGRAFATLNAQDVEGDEPGRRRLWLPLLDGTERLGVLEFLVPGESNVAPGLLAACERYAHAAAQIVLAK